MISDYDLCVIGGGINGAGIARDAAGRGLSVLLLEAEDLASGTSSYSTKLIHGGLRYLEYFQFRLVRESLKEREVLLQIAPHLIHPMEFILPHDPSLRPYWMVRAALFLYDHLALTGDLPKSRGLDLSACQAGLPLIHHGQKGFSYVDCQTDDSRLVLLNAMDAATRGATILTRTACTGLRSEDRHWLLDLEGQNGEKSQVKAQAVINATGPWAHSFLKEMKLLDSGAAVPDIRLVKGSHLIINRVYDGDYAYILQQPDKRVVFVIPYEKNYTLIGTTEEDYEGDPRKAHISEEEMSYLITAYNSSFSHKITKKDALWSYSGVRPLFDSGEGSATSATRDYKLHEHLEFSTPMISVLGGKLTTYRMLAQQAVTHLLKMQGRYVSPWTADASLPGGDIQDKSFEAFVQKKSDQYPFLPLELLERYARSYGTRMDMFLEGARGTDDLGFHFGDHVYEAEIIYLLRYEWAKTSEDILWRRTKLGLHIDDKTAEALEKALPKLLKGLEHE